MLFFKIKTFILLKIKSLNYILLFFYLIIEVKKTCDVFYIFYILSFLAYFYFFYCIVELILNLYYLNLKLRKFNILNYKLHKYIIKKHLFVLIKESNTLNIILVLTFIIFKIKVVVKILFFKYFGFFCCLPVLYAQWVLYKNLIHKYFIITDMFIFNNNVGTMYRSIKKEYKEFKSLTYPVFFIVLLEAYSLLLINKNNILIFINNIFTF